MAYAGKICLKIVAIRLGDVCEEAGVVLEKQGGFRPQGSTTDKTFVVRRLQELRRKSNTSLAICFIDLAKVYESVDRVLLWIISTCPFWSSASDDQGHPHVPRWYAG